MESTNHQIMNELKNKLSFISECIGNNGIIYIDIPMYLNVGDLLIYKGTEQFFKDYNINVVDRFSVNNFDIKRICNKYSDKVLLLQGGGNFGDIYDLHQNLRRELINSFKGKIIILPQSIHYNDNYILQDDIDLFSKHKNLFIFCRDKDSFNIACKMTSHSYLMPDMAHSLWPIKNNKYAKLSTLYFLRKDIEQNQTQNKFERENSIDWCDITTKFDNIYLRVINAILRRSKIKCIRTFITILWLWRCNSIILRSEKVFQNHNKIITSRLHGHIFSMLQDIDNIVIDNSYGKNSKYITKWTIKSTKVKLFDEK